MKFTRADGTPGLTPDTNRSLERCGAMVAPGRDARWRGYPAPATVVVNRLDVIRCQYALRTDGE